MVVDEWNADDYLVSFDDTYYAGPLVDAPIVVKSFKINRYVGEVLKGYEDVLPTPVADPVNLAAHMNVIIGDHHQRALLAMNAEASAKKHLEACADIPSLLFAHLSETAGA